MYSSLFQFIETLEQAGELIRIKEKVDPILEIPEITDRISKANPSQNKALLFENTGKDFPLLINAFGSEKRMALALGVGKLDDVAKEIEIVFKKIVSPKNSLFEKLKLLPDLAEISSWMPKVISGRGACQEIVMKEPDITKLPILKCWPEDGGNFLTLPIIHTRDPITGIRNVGLYRMQVFSKTMTAMHWHRHKVSAKHFNEYKKLGKIMPVAVALGGDPANTYCATAPLPEGVDEYMLSGFIRKKKVELVKCLTQDVEVPADADFILEGYIDPSEELILEGPFGDHTGYYSLADYYPKFHITAITHKKNAVYPATIVGIPPQEDAWLGKATERIFLAPIKLTLLPELLDMAMPVEGVFHNLVIVKIKKDYPGHAQKVMNALWGAGQMMLNKIMIVVDEHVNIHDNLEVARYVSENMDPLYDVLFTQGPMDVLDHACTNLGFGGKMGIDGTRKLPEEGTRSIERINFDSKIFSLIPNLPEIKGMNFELLKLGVSLVFVSIEKNKKDHVQSLVSQLVELESLKDVKCIALLDSNIHIDRIPNAVWRFANNIDPKRDHYSIKDKSGKTHLILDGTRKTVAFDGFERPWPNILVSDEQTIKQVDARWSMFGLGEFIPSPSHLYKDQLYPGGAVAE